MRSWITFSLIALCSCTAGTPTLIRGAYIPDEGKGIHYGECIDQEETKKWFSIAWPILLKEAAAQGFIEYGALHDYEMVETLAVCLVPEPQPCCLGGWPCAQPCSPSDKGGLACARKAGCATERYVWVSKTWPPICQPQVGGDWDQNCATTTEPTHDWRGTLVHELGNVLRLRYLHSEGYDAKTVTRLYAPGGPVSATYDALRGCLQ